MCAVSDKPASRLQRNFTKIISIVFSRSERSLIVIAWKEMGKTGISKSGKFKIVHKFFQKPLRDSPILMSFGMLIDNLALCKFPKNWVSRSKGPWATGHQTFDFEELISQALIKIQQWNLDFQKARCLYFWMLYSVKLWLERFEKSPNLELEYHQIFY